MGNETQKVDVLAVIEAAVPALCDCGHERCFINEQRADLREAHAAVAELALMMSEVLDLWDTDRMSIDAKAAALQDRPEKWRAALNRIGDMP